jgi:predicted MarR family transcription regulator
MMTVRKKVATVVESTVVTQTEIEAYKQLREKVLRDSVRVVAEKIEQIKDLLMELRDMHNDLGIEVNLNDIVSLAYDVRDETSWNSSKC